METGQQVLYEGGLYQIIHDYQNGLLEIKRVSNQFEVVLVHQSKIKTA